MERYNHVTYIIDGRLIFNQSTIKVEIKYFLINPEDPIKSTDKKTIENIFFLGFFNSMYMLIMAPIATTVKITSLTTSIINNAPFNYLIVLYRNSRFD